MSTGQASAVGPWADPGRTAGRLELVGWGALLLVMPILEPPILGTVLLCVGTARLARCLVGSARRSMVATSAVLGVSALLMLPALVDAGWSVDSESMWPFGAMTWLALNLFTLAMLTTFTGPGVPALARRWRVCRVIVAAADVTLVAVLGVGTATGAWELQGREVVASGVSGGALTAGVVAAIVGGLVAVVSASLRTHRALRADQAPAT